MSKFKLKSSRSTTKEEKIDWRQRLELIDLNKIREDRTVFFIILNECLPKYFDDIAKFQKYTYTLNVAPIKPIIYEEILYIVKHYPGWDRPYLESDFEDMLKETCAEARKYLKQKKPIPLELMAHLIKLRAILLIREDVYNENLLKMDALSKEMSEEELSSNTCESSISNVSEDDDEKRAEERKVDDKRIFGARGSSGLLDREHKSQGHPSATDVTEGYDYTDYVRDFDTVDVFFSSGSLILQEYVRTMEMRKSEIQGKRRASRGFTPLVLESDLHSGSREQYKPPWFHRRCKWLKQKTVTSANVQDNGMDAENKKALYIILTGFYDPYLILSLYKIAVPISCIIRIAIKDDKPIDPTVPFNIKTTSLASPFSVVPVYHYSLQNLYTQPGVVIKLGDLNYDDMKDQLVYHFWSTLDELFLIYNETLKDTICILCPPVDYRGRYISPTSSVYKEQGETIFKNILNLLEQLPYFWNLHTKYLNCLKIFDLGSAPECIPASEMFYYNEVINKLPSNCYSVGLSMEGLLQEVEQTSFSEQRRISFEENEKKKNNFRKFLKIKKLWNKILEAYHFTQPPLNFILFLQKYRTCFPDLKYKVCLPERFEINDGDILELQAKYYPQCAEKIRNWNLNDIKKSIPYSLSKLYNHIQNLENTSTFNSNQYHTWSSLLGLSPYEITERLKIYMFNMLACKQKEKRQEPYFELLEHFAEDRLDNTIFLDREVNPSKIFQISNRNLYEDYDENKFKWEENLKSNILLQKFQAYKTFFKCMDCAYIPFIDSIAVRFHDRLDKFGVSSETWIETIRSPVNLHDFFKSVIFNDPATLVHLLSNTDNLAEKTHPPTEPAAKCKTASAASKTVNEPDTGSIQSHFNAYNLNSRKEASGVTTLFRSLDGLKITVEKMFLFSAKPNLKITLEASRNTVYMHIQQFKSSKFSFHIDAPNGARIVFSKPEPYEHSTANKILRMKGPEPKKTRYYSIKEIKTIGFGARLSLHRMHFLNEISLVKVLSSLLPLQHCSSTETLQLLDSRRSIFFKSTTSMTDVRWRNKIPKTYIGVIRAIKRVKQEAIPHFKIISTALHKTKYVNVIPLKLKLTFADGVRVIRYIPNLETKKKIEITKCIPFTPKTKGSSCGFKGNLAATPAYDTRLSLPNGLQVASEPSIEPGTINIVQYYIPNNPNLPDEVSRTFTCTGQIQIKYRDGTIKMIASYGRRVIGSLPCVSTVKTSIKKPQTRKVERVRSIESITTRKFMKLQKSICRKISRYQSKFIHAPVKSYSQNKSNRSINKKNSINLKKSCISGLSLPISRSHFYNALEYHAPEQFFYDFYTIDSATVDSHSSINDEGELVTIYVDGTKITSWFKIDQDMILLDDDNDANTWEVDIDDYTCNFLIPRVGGWISVQVFYQYEHPEYATVVCCGKNETYIRLPGVEYQARADGSFFINSNDDMYAHIDRDNIRFSTHFCKSCYDYCQTTINVKYLRNGEAEVKDDEILLEARDTFRKVFKVSYSGTCYRNDNYEAGDKKEDCHNHKMADTQKFFVFNKNFDGKLYWDSNKLQNKLIDSQVRKGFYKKPYLDETDNIRAYDFSQHHYVHYSERFLMKYRHPSPPIFQYLPQKEISRVIYRTKRQVSIVPDCTQVLPLVTLIQDLRVNHPQELPLPKFENIFQLEEYLHPKAVEIKSSADSINMKLSPVFAEVVADNFTKLMKTINKFEVTTMRPSENFEKRLEFSEESSCYDMIDESPEIFFKAESGETSMHPKLLYDRILEHKRDLYFNKRRMPNHEKSRRSKNSEEIPLVPKNSNMTVDFDDIPQVAGLVETMVSHSNFQKKSEKLAESSQSKNLVSQEDVKAIPLLAEVDEWRKPICTLETDSSVSLSLKESKRVNVKTKDKQVNTGTPFDLFENDHKFLQHDELSKISNSFSKKQHKRRVDSQHLWQKFDNYSVSKRPEPSKVESKQSKLMTGVQAIESYNQVYDKFISLYKDIPKNMKRFTEVHRYVGDKRISSQNLVKEERSLPLILPPSQKTRDIRPESKTQTSSQTSTTSPKTELKIAVISSFSERRGIQSTTLRRLSEECLSSPLKSLRQVPADIDQKVQSMFYANSCSRKEINTCCSESDKPSSTRLFQKDDTCICIPSALATSKRDSCDSTNSLKAVSRCSSKVLEYEKPLGNVKKTGKKSVE